MALSTQQIRNLIRSATGQDTISLPDTEVLATTPGISCDTFMNRAWWQMLNNLELREKELTTVVPIAAGATSFVLPAGVTSDAIRHAAIIDPDDLQSYPLAEQTIKWYREIYNTDTNQEDRPTNYVPDGALFYLWPVPDVAYTINADYWAVLDDASLAGIGTPRETGEIVLNGAIARVFSELNGNPAKAQFYFNLTGNYLNNYIPQKAKSEMDYSDAGLEVRGREY